MNRFRHDDAFNLQDGVILALGVGPTVILMLALSLLLCNLQSVTLNPAAVTL